MLTSSHLFLKAPNKETLSKLNSYEFMKILSNKLLTEKAASLLIKDNRMDGHSLSIMYRNENLDYEFIVKNITGHYYVNPWLLINLVDSPKMTKDMFKKYIKPKPHLIEWLTNAKIIDKMVV